MKGIGILAVIIISLTCNYCFAQQNKYRNGIKVVISNFNESPPGCGFFMNKSLYEAEVVDSLSLLFSKKILICVTCKADRYKFVTGSRFILTISDESQFVEGIYNFTKYTTEELKKMKMHNALSLIDSDRKLRQ